MEGRQLAAGTLGTKLVASFTFAYSSHILKLELSNVIRDVRCNMKLSVVLACAIAAALLINVATASGYV